MRSSSVLSASVLSSSLTRVCSSPRRRITMTTPKMDNKTKSHNHNNNNSETVSTTTSSSLPNGFDKFQQVLHSHSTDGWQKCWEQELTPWDLGQPTPVLVHLHNTGALPKGRALLPGCGSGYDVVAIAGPDHYVVGLDISELAIEKAKELSSSSSGEYFEFLKTDFFTWCPTDLFDLIFDYTFFCAIKPEMRSAWALKIRDLLKPDGELITLIFPISDHEGGPPYKVSVTDYEELLHPLGFEAISIVDNELAVASRKGKEKLARWKRSLCRSAL